MTREEAAIIIGNIPIDGSDQCYSIPEYQEAKTMAIESLKAEPCENCVSREAVNALYDKYHASLATHVYEFGEELKALPPATPAKKKGKWIKTDENTYHCSLCGRTVHKDSLEDMQIDYPYCHCGAKMEGVGA